MAYPYPYIAILDVGHGNSAVIKDADGTMIIDCGGRSAGLMEFLKKEGISKIDSVILSHSDQDHIGGLVGLIASDEFEISNVVVNSDSSKGSLLWDDLLYALSHTEVNGGPKLKIGISRSDDPFICGKIKAEVIGPTGYLAGKGAGGKDRQDRSITSNSISASFRLFWEDSCIAYLAGDLDQIGLDDLVEHEIVFNSPLLVFPHHGGKSDNFDIVSFTEKLCNVVSPSAVVFSIGRNKFDNPRPEVITTVKRVIQNVRISCSQLSTHCTKLLPTIGPKHLPDVFSRGHEKNECCGGTFLIQLGNPVQYFPELKSHREFITTATSSPLCN